MKYLVKSGVLTLGSLPAVYRGGTVDEDDLLDEGIDVDRLIKLGAIEAAPEEEPQSDPEEDYDLTGDEVLIRHFNDMTVEALRELAEEWNLDLGDLKRKADIVQYLVENRPDGYEVEA